MQLIQPYFNLPHFDHFNPPASESALAALEHQWGVALPASFRAFYRQHDGQQLALEDLEQGEVRFLSVAEMAQVQADWRGFVEQHFGADYRALQPEFYDENVQSALYLDKWLPFMQDSDGSLYCLDFAPSEQGEQGQVIFIGLAADLESYDVLYESPDFQQWLLDLQAAYQSDFEKDLPALCADYWQQQLNQNPDVVNAPVSQSALTTLTRRLPYAVPEDLLGLYRLMNGQSALGAKARFVPVEEMANVQESLLHRAQSALGEHWAEVRMDNGTMIQNVAYHPLWLPFYQADKALYCYDPVPHIDGNIGQIIQLDTENFHSVWCFESMHEAMMALLQSALDEGA